MKLLRCAAIAMIALLMSAPVGWASSSTASPPPMGSCCQRPSTDRALPAAPFVIGAYSCFLVLMVGYAWSMRGAELG